MKAGLVCALVALKAIVQSGVRLKGSILLGALCDEEGGMLGVKHFVESGWADRVSAAIICEPEENHLCIRQKGVMWVHATIRGVMAHGAMPLTGVNTAYPMARFLTLVHSLEEREIARFPRDPLLGQPSITPNILLSPPRGSGEPQNNVMPAATEVVLDFRLIPGQDPDALAKQIEALLAATVAVDPRLGYDMQVVEVRHPTRTSETEPVVMALASAYTDITGAKPDLWRRARLDRRHDPERAQADPDRDLRPRRHSHSAPHRRMGLYRRDQDGGADVCGGGDEVFGRAG